MNKKNKTWKFLGHNLGAIHDGTVSNGLNSLLCPARTNFVMTAVIGYYSSSLKNLFYFSNCSKAQIKKTLLNADG